MNSIITLIVLGISLCCAAGACAGLRDPFPPGFGMATLGSIVDEHGASGREPWTSAALCNDSTGFAAALAGTSYFGSPGEAAGDLGIGQCLGGIAYCRKQFMAKAAIAYLNALGVYYEKCYSASFGARALHFMRASVEIAASQTGVRITGTPVHSIAETGASLWVPWSWAALSCRLEHLLLERSQADGADPPLTIRCGLHTVSNLFGGQGVLVSVIPEENRPLCFTIGEELRIAPGVLLHAALSNNPVLISCGVSFQVHQASFSCSLVDHSLLGWSQGLAAEYYHKK